MSKTVTIHEAKTHLSEYIRQAKAGQPVYIGAYGEREVVLTAAKPGKKLTLGIWRDKPVGYKDEDVIGSDPDILADFEQNIDKPLPQ